MEKFANDLIHDSFEKIKDNRYWIKRAFAESHDGAIAFEDDGDNFISYDGDIIEDKDVRCMCLLGSLGHTRRSYVNEGNIIEPKEIIKAYYSIAQAINYVCDVPDELIEDLQHRYEDNEFEETTIDLTVCIQEFNDDAFTVHQDIIDVGNKAKELSK